jgi:hypothetical protein
VLADLAALLAGRNGRSRIAASRERAQVHIARQGHVAIGFRSLNVVVIRTGPGGSAPARQASGLMLISSPALCPCFCASAHFVELNLRFTRPTK